MLFILNKILKLALKCAILAILISSCTLGLLGVLWILDSRHEYSFALFSIKLVAFSYITACVALFTATLLGLSLSGKDNRVKNILIFDVCLISSIFLLLFIGAFGLYSISSEKINSSVKHSMLNDFENFNEQNKDLHATKSLDWLHRKFNCCGIHSYVKFKFI